MTEDLQAVRVPVVGTPRLKIASAIFQEDAFQVDAFQVDVSRGDESEIMLESGRSAPPPIVPWLESAAFLVPKSIREPFLGDLREDLAEMGKKGLSSASIRWAAASQILILVLRWLWANLVSKWWR